MENVEADVAVLGGGPAGYVAAIRAAQLGASVALVEEREVGGTCLNRGCIPTKALLRSSEAALFPHRAQELGVEGGPGSLRWEVARARSARVVKSLRAGVEHLLAGNKVRVLGGHGEIRSAHRLLVNSGGTETAVSCRKLIIATGSVPVVPDIPGIDRPGVITSEGALELAAVPSRLVVLGAGAVGLEFAAMYGGAGSRVTVVELRERILPQEDPEIAAEMLKIMKRQGVAFRLSSRVVGIEKAGGCLAVTVEEEGRRTVLETDLVLVAVGRKPATSSPDLGALGVALEKDAIVVDERMETTVPGVYAAGDAVGGRLLAHLAFAEGRVAAQNALGLPSQLNYGAVPSCVYTSPQTASVGLTEEDCRRRGIDYRTGRFAFRNNGRALTMGERDGFAKVVVDKDTQAVLGAQIVGAEAAELISVLTLAVARKIPAGVLADLVYPHPALGEAVMEACGDALGRAIHKG